MYILVLNFFLWFLICMTNVAIALKMYHVNTDTSYQISGVEVFGWRMVVVDPWQTREF